MRPVARRPFVGRSRELDELSAALDGARTGTARLVLLRGEPGIGKTRLAEELSDLAQTRGFTVAWGRCWETPGAPAYWPWRQLFDELKLATPELDAALSGLAEPAASGEAQRAELYRLVGHALRSRAEAGPLLLVFEDLHAADLPTLHLLTTAVRTLKRSSVLWLLTARALDPRLTEELEALLSKLSREGVRVEPRRFDPGAVAELAAALLNRPLSDAVLRAVVEATEGTPLYVDGTLRLIDTRGDATPLPVPESARDVLRDRLDLLPPRSRDVLELAAVAGQTFSRPVLVTAAGGAPRYVDDALGPALKAGLVRELGVDALAFAHALLREALYGALTPRRRAELHHRVLIALEQAGASLEELAHHALAALPLGSLDEAVAHAVAAARHAHGLLAFERAAELYERALQATAGEGHTARRADLFIAHAHALIRAGRGRLGIAAAEAGAASARALDDPERLAAAALASGSVFRLGHVDPALVGLLAEALAAIGTAHPKLAPKLKARLASARQPDPDPSGPVALAKQAIAEARALGDPSTLMSTLHFGLSAMGDLTAASLREPMIVELIALAAAQKDKVLEQRNWARLAITRYELGQIAQVDACVRELERLAGELGPAYRLPPLLFRHMRALFDGRFADADRLVAEVSSLAEEHEAGDVLTTLGMQYCGRLTFQCRTAELASAVDTIVDSMNGTPMQEQGADMLCGAYAAARGGELDQARAYLARAPRDFVTYPDRGSLFWAGTAVGLTGDARLAALIEPALRACTETFATSGLIGMTVEGPMAWARGLLAHALGRRDEALAELDRAHADCVAAGARAFAVRVLADRDLVAGTREHSAEIARVAAELNLPGLLGAAPPVARTPPPAVATPTAPTLTRDGETWVLHADGQRVRLKDSRGVQMLATLVEHPGREVHVLELSGSDASADSDAGDVLDATAKADYRARVASLNDELEEARAFNDPGRARRAQAELDFIAEELAAGVGLGGRSRKAASNAERARVNVQRRLKDALKRIEEQAPELGRKMSRSVRTGTLCSFEYL